MSMTSCRASILSKRQNLPQEHGLHTDIYETYLQNSVGPVGTDDGDDMQLLPGLRPQCLQ